IRSVAAGFSPRGRTAQAEARGCGVLCRQARRLPMGARRIRREQRRYDMAQSRVRNGELKENERGRRKARMVEIIQRGKLPDTAPVMSWLSGELNKPSRLITQDEVDALVRQG